MNGARGYFQGARRKTVETPRLLQHPPGLSPPSTYFSDVSELLERTCVWNLSLLDKPQRFGLCNRLNSTFYFQFGAKTLNVTFHREH